MHTTDLTESQASQLASIASVVSQKIGRECDPAYHLDLASQEGYECVIRNNGFVCGVMVPTSRTRMCELVEEAGVDREAAFYVCHFYCNDTGGGPAVLIELRESLSNYFTHVCGYIPLQNEAALQVGQEVFGDADLSVDEAGCRLFVTPIRRTG